MARKKETETEPKPLTEITIKAGRRGFVVETFVEDGAEGEFFFSTSKDVIKFLDGGPLVGMPGVQR